MRVIKGKVHQPYEVKGSSIFYAFSYYFDRAVESGLIGEWVHAKESPSSAIIFQEHYHLEVGIQITCLLFFSAQITLVEVRLKSGTLRREPKKVRVTRCPLCR